jgi:diketogulonate reductase-like aldo/keto reductase
MSSPVLSALGEFALWFMSSCQGNPGEMKQVEKDAIDAGYRHIDTALFYENEKEAGAAIRAKIADGNIKREDVCHDKGKTRRVIL